MNKNQYPADCLLIAARDLMPGVRFIHNYMGGNRTVYVADRVIVGAGRAVITYHIETEDAKVLRSEFYTAGLSTLVIVD